MTTKKRSKVVNKLFIEEIKNEKTAIRLLIAAMIYALLSCIFYRCDPFPFSDNILNILASIDEFIRNCCFGVVASVTFYLFHDYIRNLKKKVDIRNSLFSKIYDLWWNMFIQLKMISNDEFKCTLSIDDAFNMILFRFYPEPKEAITGASVTQISYVDFYHIQTGWEFAMLEKKKFLEIYGNDISRKEFLKLNDVEYDIACERLRDLKLEDESTEKNKTVTIRVFDLHKVIRLMVQYQSVLAEMVVSYSKYDYSEIDRKMMPYKT